VIYRSKVEVGQIYSISHDWLTLFKVGMIDVLVLYRETSSWKVLKLDDGTTTSVSCDALLLDRHTTRLV